MSPTRTPSASIQLDLVTRAQEGQRLALERLLDLRTNSGIWDVTHDVGFSYAQLYVIMLRTTGIIECPDAQKDEVQIVRHLIRQVNADGGFFKYRGSPSSTSITQLSVLALRICLGDVRPSHWPAAWFQQNKELDDQLVGRLNDVLRNAEGYLEHADGNAGVAFELDHIHFTKLLTAYVEQNVRLPSMPPLEPEFGLLMRRSPLLGRIERTLNRITRKSLPAISILYRAVRNRTQSSSGSPQALASLRKIGERRHQRSVSMLADLLCSEQNTNGAWLFNSYSTMLNIMALREAGCLISDASIQSAYEYVRQRIRPADDEGAFIDGMDSELWDTCLATLSYLNIPGHAATDREIVPSLRFLLDSQEEGGGFAWAGGSENDVDNDSTALAVRALAVASMTAPDKLGEDIERALQRGKQFLLAKQDRRGGFSIWESTFATNRRGSLGILKQILFDVATPDNTARVLSGLVECGLGRTDQQIRKGLKFFLSRQCRNGAWWCRWWAGYISGTGYVLQLFGDLGFDWMTKGAQDDRLMRRSHRAMVRGMEFLLRHQNQDGGWGETTRSDTNACYAGIGETTPLHTAHAIIALLACGYPAQSAVINRAVSCLLALMTSDGRWEDGQTTFTVFASSLYYHYSIYRYVLPLDALTWFVRSSSQGA